MVEIGGSTFEYALRTRNIDPPLMVRVRDSAHLDAILSHPAARQLFVPLWRPVGRWNAYQPTPTLRPTEGNPTA